MNPPSARRSSSVFAHPTGLRRVAALSDEFAGDSAAPVPTSEIPQGACVHDRFNTDLDHMGAIDHLVVEFRDREITCELIPDLLDLVDRRLIRIMDVVIVLTADDGS